MKIVTINQTLLKEFQKDPEVLKKTARPCVLIIRLKYKGVNRSFAVPLRSNISAHTPKDQYFALPTRSSTRAGNHHGLHYIKMFPVIKKLPFRMKSEGSRRFAYISPIIKTASQGVSAELVWCNPKNHNFLFSEG